MRPWHFGNTTVRSPFRLREGLVALAGSSLEGNLHGKTQENAFRLLLGSQGIVDLGEDSTYSVGRKWRSALSKLGFLYPKLPNALARHQKNLGAIDTITENGRRLIVSQNVAGWQECFLRSLAASFIPSPLESRFQCAVFSPLRHVLTLMTELQKRTGENKLDFLEMAIFVQTTSSDTSLQDLAENMVPRYFKWVGEIVACPRRGRSWRSDFESIGSLAPWILRIGPSCLALPGFHC